MNQNIIFYIMKKKDIYLDYIYHVFDDNNYQCYKIVTIIKELILSVELWIDFSKKFSVRLHQT